MEFESPVKGQDNRIIIRLQVANNLSVQYTTTDKYPIPDKRIELVVYLASIAKNFEEYSVKWLTSPVSSTHFLQRIEHKWSHELYAPPAYSESKTRFTARQVWCPKQIILEHRKFIVDWILQSVEYLPIFGFDTNVIVDKFSNSTPLVPSSGLLDESIDIPYALDLTVATIVKSSRARTKERIRRARIRAAKSKWKLNELLDSYYTKYGAFEGLDKESELSSEIDSNTESNSKK